MPMAPDSVWDTYIRSHPAAEKFRIHGIANYSILHELCANMTATGEFALATNLTFSGLTDGSGLGGLGGEGLLASGRADKEKENGKPGRGNNKNVEAIGEQKESLNEKEKDGKKEKTEGFDGLRWHEINESTVRRIENRECGQGEGVLSQVDGTSEQDSDEGNRNLEGRMKRSSSGVGKKERKKAKLSILKLKEEEDEKGDDGYEGEQRTQQTPTRD